MKVVSNTSPIINLACIGQLNLLHQLYGEVIIPGAVYEEITVTGAGEPGSSEVQDKEWIVLHPLVNRPLVDALRLEIDPGEAEAIACAIELRADWLLLDERLGRRVAGRLGVRYIGLLGVLIEAKRNGLIAAVKPALDDLISKAGFWIKKELYNRVLEAVGET